MKTPWHIWVVGIVTLAWNALGLFDYVMTQTRNPAYMAQFTPAQLEYFYGFPLWVQLVWGGAVFFSVAGSILLLLRLRLAAPVFGLAFLCMLLVSLHNYILDDVNPVAITGVEAAIFSGVIAVVALLLWLYARAMRKRGVLR